MKLQNIKLKMLSNFISSIKGWKIYHKIVHKYPLKRGLYILIPEMDEKLSFCAALYLNQLLLISYEFKKTYSKYCVDYNRNIK